MIKAFFEFCLAKLWLTRFKTAASRPVFPLPLPSRFEIALSTGAACALLAIAALLSTSATADPESDAQAALSLSCYLAALILVIISFRYISPSNPPQILKYPVIFSLLAGTFLAIPNAIPMIQDLPAVFIGFFGYCLAQLILDHFAQFKIHDALQNNGGDPASAERQLQANAERARLRMCLGKNSAKPPSNTKNRL